MAFKPSNLIIVVTKIIIYLLRCQGWALGNPNLEAKRETSISAMAYLT